MPKYLVMLRCSRARSNANRHRQETPAYLPYRSVAGWNGAGVTAPCIIIGREFEAETERAAGEAAEKSADEQFPEYAPFAVVRKVV